MGKGKVENIIKNGQNALYLFGGIKSNKFRGGPTVSRYAGKKLDLKGVGGGGE